MRHIITSCLIAVCAMTAIAQHTPVYLDETQSIERRIDDALSRMTLQEKIRKSKAYVIQKPHKEAI